MRTEIQTPETFGFYRRPDVMFGSFDRRNVCIIQHYAHKCDYQIEQDGDVYPRTIKIMSLDRKRYGWLKRLWKVGDDGTMEADIVYGIFKKGKYIKFHSIVPQILNLDKMLRDIQEGNRVIQASRMRKIRIPELEPNREQLKVLWKKKTTTA